MIKAKMYVRIPSDFEDSSSPKIFIMGQVISVNEFAETAKIQIHDPFQTLRFFPQLKNGIIEEPITNLKRCTFFEHSFVMYLGSEYEVIAVNKIKNDYTLYYIQNRKTKIIDYVSEKDIIASFDNGQVSPTQQLMDYEFQNPAWYGCRNIVAKTLNVLDNSIAGFKDLAGCKIFLLPHQLNTIMRCLQEERCRFMLSDEVGMGKTIEALSVYKLFIKKKYRCKTLILVPDTLAEQWKTEMFLKFNILPGIDRSNNELVLKTPTTLTNSDLKKNWDFLIVDEVHNYLRSDLYKSLLLLSKSSENVLLLSATPVQQREQEYLDLLRLLLPAKYEHMSLSEFSDLIKKQRAIVQNTTNILGDVEDYVDEIENVLESGDLPEEDEDCCDIYEEIIEEIEDLAKLINNEIVDEFVENINFENDGYGVNEMKTLLSFICSNFQIENSIIRNRRKILELDDDEDQVIPIRKLIDVTYDLDSEINLYETNAYRNLLDWLNEQKNHVEEFAKNYVKPLFSSFFSSVFALEKELKKFHIDDPVLINNITKWKENDIYILNQIVDILDDPDTYEKFYNHRLVKTLNFLYEDITSEKVVLFTDHIETFNVYKKALNLVFGDEKVCSYSRVQEDDDNELNVYRFQNDKNSQFLLCDSSGGEGRNFQCADYVVHIDLPWDANTIEQRIGRLDRLERDVERNIVYSVVIRTVNTFEGELFDFWNKGLSIFTKSLSGMEIIMKDINDEIMKAIDIDIEYQLADQISSIIELSQKLSEEVKRERDFDAASIMYRPLFIELKKLIRYYTTNENALFANAMAIWAGMAGFHGDSFNSIISYYPNKFGIKSAIKSLLMPPRFNEYILSTQNQFITKVSNMYTNEDRKNDRIIRGTFNRKKAIENDYLHFFAPGDAIFDCIVDNALKSCKGQACAFASQANYNWKGFVFTFKMTPNILSVLEKNKSAYLLNSYRNYLCNDFISIPISIDNPENISDDLILREFNRILLKDIRLKNQIHLGKRKTEHKFLANVIEGKNIDWFKLYYPKEQWRESVITCYKEAIQKAKEKFRSKSNIKGAKEEMRRQISSRVSNLGYYGVNDESVELLQEQHSAVIEALKSSKVILDSACFIWMVKE